MKGIIDRLYRKFARFFLSSEEYATTINIKRAIDKGVKVGSNCRFYSVNFSSEPYLIEIGNHVTITEGVQFITHDGGAWVLRGLYEEYKHCNILGKIKIGDNVFIGVNTIIMPGIEIGDNCIIAAGSVITKSFNSNQIIGGIPAKVIKPLEEYIKMNKNYLVNTKNLNNEERKEFILKRMNSNQFRKK